MKAVVVYESHWGNTEAVARAIAEGIGPDAQALPTDEATAEVVGPADLIVAGAPVMAFGLPGERALTGLERSAHTAETPPDLSRISLRTWLNALPQGHAVAAAFETRMRWSPGGATGTIERSLTGHGHRIVSQGHKFVVTGQSGPLRDGELDRARQWGAELGLAARTAASAAAARQ